MNKPLNNRAFGKIGEDAAEQYLKDKEYLILTRNFRVGRFGEIDIIAKINEYICFIEVKSRSSSRFGSPAEAVNYKKIQYIRRLSEIYLDRYRSVDSQVRFDVMEVFFNCDRSHVERINHIEAAF